jgi:hypothetical protein
MNKKRLLKLAYLLEADAKKKKGIRFDLASWGYVSDDAMPLSCGTTACAAGLAAVSGAFKRSGLSYRLDGCAIKITLNGQCRDRGGWKGSFLSAIKFFDLSKDEGQFLFVDRFYAGLPKSKAEGEIVVAQRIRDFVAGNATP